MSEKDLQQMAEEMSRCDKYVDQIADRVYERLFKDFSRVEDYLKAAGERSHQQQSKKYRLLERRVWAIAVVLLILQFLFK
jgi:molecular chaperone GrpE (heat shock protein)